MFKYCLIPFFFTTFVGLFFPILPNEIVTLEFIFRIYFSLASSLVYIVYMYLTIYDKTIMSSNKIILFYNLMSMLNYMNGNTFIPNITSVTNRYLLDSIIFMLYTCCNILSLVYIVEHKYLGIQYRYLDNLITTNDFDDGYSEDNEFSDENNVESESSSDISTNEMDCKKDQ